MIRVANTERGN